MYGDAYNTNALVISIIMKKSTLEMVALGAQNKIHAKNAINIDLGGGTRRPPDPQAGSIAKKVRVMPQATAAPGEIRQV